MPARIVVDHGKIEDLSDDEIRRRGDAADRLFKEITGAVAERRR